MMNTFKAFRVIAMAAPLLAGLFYGGASAQAQDMVLEEIIVTAQKRDQNVRDVASTVNVISGATVEEYHIIDFSDLERYTSGLALTKINARNSTISIRGVTTDPEAGFAVQGVEAYVNNAPQRYDSVFVGLYDIDRVEVLRGPQGALQGRTSPAGSIQIHTARADLNDTEGYIKGLVGSNEATNYQGAIGFPLVEGRVAVRFSAFLDENDGEEITNIITGEVQDQDGRSARMSVQLQPNDDLNINLMYQDITQLVHDAKPLEGSRSTAYSVTVPEGSPGAGMVIPTSCDDNALAGHDRRSCGTLTAEDKLALASLDDYGELNAEVFTANADWQFHDDYKFSYVFSYTESKKETRQQNDRSFYLPLQNAFYANVVGVESDTDYLTHQDTTTEVEATTHELRFESSDNSVWNYMIGLYSSDQDTSTRFDGWSTLARYAPVADIIRQGIPMAVAAALAEVAKLGLEGPEKEFAEAAATETATAAILGAASMFDPLIAPIPAMPEFMLPAHMLTINNLYIEGVNFSTGGQIPVNQETMAIFTHHSFQLTEQLVLEAALRYQEIEGYRRTDIVFGQFNQEDRISVGYRDAVSDSATINGLEQLRPGTINAIANGVALATVNTPDPRAPDSPALLPGYLAGLRGLSIVGVPDAYDSPEYDALTGSLSLRFDINEAISTYASVNTAYRPGGISIVPGQPLPLTDLLYDEEDSIAYEIGFKSLLLNGRAQFNGALYYQTFDGFLGRVTELQADYSPDNSMPVQFPGGIVFNGDAEFNGIELDGRFLLTENWLIGGALNYSKAEWSKAQAPCNDRDPGQVIGRCDYDGRRVAGTPEFSINLNTEYTANFGGAVEFFIRLNAKYNGGIVATAADRPNTAGVVVAAGETDAYTVVDLLLGFRGDNSWEATLWSKNLTDEDARTDLTNPGDNFDVVGDFREVRRLQERTYGATFSYYF